MFDRDRLPYPFRFPRQDGTAAETTAARRDAAARVEVLLDDRLTAAMRTLLEPAIRVEVYGFAEPAMRIRLHAGLTHSRGILAAQYPGPTAEFGADVVLREVAPTGMARAVVEWLPKVAAGSRQGLAVRRPEPPLAPYRENPINVPEGERQRRFFARERTSAGEVGVHRGPALDWQSGGGPTIRWIDFVGDGRYRIHPGRSIRAVPMDNQTFVAAVGERIEKEGRASAAWQH